MQCYLITLVKNNLTMKSFPKQYSLLYSTTLFPKCFCLQICHVKLFVYGEQLKPVVFFSTCAFIKH